MKYLSDYKETKHTELLNNTGAFFAFSTEQFNDKKKPDTKYVNCKHGLICPKGQVDNLLDGLSIIHEEAIKEDLAENGIKAIIKRELYNYECFYTGDISDAVSTLKAYDITEDQVQDMYRKEYKNADL